MELVLDADLFKSRSGGRVELRSLTAVRQVDGIHVLHELQRLLFPDVFVERPAEVIRDIVFPVAERAGPAKARHDRAALAADTGPDPLPVDRTAPLRQLLSALEYADLQIRPLFHQLIRGKNTSRSGADDHYVIFVFHVFPYKLPAPRQIHGYRAEKNQGHRKAPHCCSLRVLRALTSRLSLRGPFYTGPRKDQGRPAGYPRSRSPNRSPHWDHPDPHPPAE